MCGLVGQLLPERSKRGMFRAGRMRTWGPIVASILSSSGPTELPLVGGVCKATVAKLACRQSDPAACISFFGCRQSDRKATQGASTSMGAITLCRSPVRERAKRRAAMSLCRRPKKRTRVILARFLLSSGAPIGIWSVALCSYSASFDEHMKGGRAKMSRERAVDVSEGFTPRNSAKHRDRDLTQPSFSQTLSLLSFKFLRSLTSI